MELKHFKLFRQGFLEYIKQDQSTSRAMRPTTIHSQNLGNLQTSLANFLLNNSHYSDLKILFSTNDADLMQYVQISQSDEFLILFRDTINYFISKQYIRFSGGNGYQETGIQYTSDAYFNFKNIPQKILSNPEFIISSLEQELSPPTDVINLLRESISCFDNQLYKASIIILGLSSTTHIDNLLQKWIETTETNSIKTKCKEGIRGGAENKFRKLKNILNREVVKEAIEAFAIDTRLLEAIYEMIRIERNKIVHPMGNQVEDPQSVLTITLISQFYYFIKASTPLFTLTETQLT